MTRFRISLSIGAAAVGLFLAAAPAEAQLLVSYVHNATGLNTNSCGSPDSPCSNIFGALLKTRSGGEIKCLDGHQDGNGTVTIDKPITIDCGASSSTIIGAAGNVAITVNLNEATDPNGVVTLRNLSINGGDGVEGPGSDGIRVIGGGAAVHIENSSIRGFAEQGIDFAPTSSVDLFARDSIIANNAGGGVVIAPAAAAAVRGSLSNVRLDRNGFGFSMTKTSGGFAVMTVEDTNIEKNVVGLRANGASAYILLSGSTIAHNSTGLQTLSGGKISSSGDNMIRFNGVDGAPSITVPLK